MCSINNMGQAEGRTDCHSDKKCLCDVEHQGNVRAPDSGVLSFGTDCIGANFLSSSASWKDMGWKKFPSSRHESQDNLISLGSLDSFKSLSSSFQSFVEEEMYSAKSSMMDTQTNGEGFISISDRFSSRDSIGIDNNFNTDTRIRNNVVIKSNDVESAQNVDELDTTLTASLLDTVTETMKDSLDAASRPRTSTTISEFDVIDKDIDVRCNSRICSCSKANTGRMHKKVVENGQIGGMKGRNNIDVSDLASTTVTIKDHSPICDYYIKSSYNFDGKEGEALDNFNERIYESGDSVNVKGLKSGDKMVNTDILNVDSYLKFSADMRNENVKDTMDIERFKCDNYSENSAVLSEKLEGISEAFLPHTQCSIKEISSDLVGAWDDQFQNTDTDACDINKPDVHNNVEFVIDSHRTSRTECINRKVENFGEQTESCSNSLEGMTEVFQPHLQFSINEDESDISVECNIEPIDSKSRSKQDSDKLKTDHTLNSDKSKQDFSELRTYHIEDKTEREIMDTDQIQVPDGISDNEHFKGKIASETGLTDVSLDYSVDADKLKEKTGPINGLWRVHNNLTGSSMERSMEEETRHRRIRRKWRLTHPLKDFTESNHFQDHGLLKVLTSYNNLQHVIYSLLSGRPVVVIGTKRHEAILKELLQALNVFVPVVPGCDHVSLLCQIKQLKVVDVHKFLLRGIIRSEKKCLDYIIPQSIRRYITLFDVEKSLISCIPYQGSLLSFVSAIYHKKKVFKTEQALHTFIQMCLMEISSKAFSFYHCICMPDMETNYIGVTLTRKSSMLELSADKYLNKSGLLNADSRIIKHLAEIVKIQQIDEEFKCKNITESPVYPFNIAYNTVQTFRC